MSNNEFGNPSQAKSFQFAAMVAGVTGPSNVPNFYNGTSQIDRIERVTAGGVPGQPFISTITPNAVFASPPSASITLRSEVNTDTSVYRIWFHDSSNAAQWN